MSQNNVDLLGQTTAASTETINADLADLREAAASMEYSAGQVVNAGSDLGIEGAAGEAAMDACVTISRKLKSCVDEIERLSAAGVTAQTALTEAQNAHAALPPMSMPQTIDAYLYNLRSTTPDAVITLDGVPGTVTAAEAEQAWYAERKRQREAAAAAALAKLQAAMQVATADLNKGGVDPGYDPTTPGSSGGHTTGTGTVAAPVPAGGSGVGGTGSSGIGGTGSSGVGGTGSSGVGGTGSSGVGGTGSSGVGGSGGSVGGYIPGGTGSGPGTGVGGSGSQVGIGGSTGIGASGGLLAGGTSIAGVVAGARALGRMGGLGGASGVGGLGSGGLGSAGSGGLSGSGAGVGASGIGGSGARGTGLGGSNGSGLVAGTSSTGAAGSAGGRSGAMMGGGMGGGGGAGGAGKGKRGRAAHLLGPDVEIEDDPVVIDLGPGARAGDRNHLPTAVTAFDEIDPDDHW